MIRQVCPEDTGEITALWHCVFGDHPDYIRFFLKKLPEFGVGACAVEDGITAFAFVLKAGSTGYLYAVATAPAHRKKGLGEAVCRAAVQYAAVEQLYTLPASDALARWYGKLFGMQPVLPMAETEITGRGLTEQITPVQYQQLREQLTGDCFPLAWYEVQDALCRCYGGGLFRQAKGVFSGYYENDQLLIHDWAGALPDCHAIVRTPAEAGSAAILATPGAKPQFGMTLD